jgi:hypothetical protein
VPINVLLILPDGVFLVARPLISTRAEVSPLRAQSNRKAAQERQAEK